MGWWDGEVGRVKGSWGGLSGEGESWFELEARLKGVPGEGWKDGMTGRRGG